jgi:ABC-type nitrate/sulfonate/bicarbonate transport system ATPase subunit
MSSHGSLTLQNVSKSFTTHSRTLPVLKQISLDISPGEFVTIVGMSGCGKSTLLRLLTGLETADAGSLLHNGAPIHGASLQRGLVFQNHRLLPWLNVFDNVMLALQTAPLNKPAKVLLVEQQLRLVGLEKFAQAWPYELSGGMAQRVAIARALVNRPEILLLDEPFGALDSLTRARMQDELLRIRDQEGITMVLVTHDVEEAVYLADRVVVMEPNPGRIRRVVAIPTGRPRRRDSIEFLEHQRDILQEITASVPAALSH